MKSVLQTKNGQKNALLRFLPFLKLINLLNSLLDALLYPANCKDCQGQQYAIASE